MAAGAHASTNDAELLRGAAYARRVLAMFEGVEPAVREDIPLQGNAVASAFGAGRIASMQGRPMMVHRPTAANDATGTSFNLFINIHGSTEIDHCGRVARLSAGDTLLLDGSFPFRADMRTDYSQMLIQFPREAVGRRHAELLRRAGMRFAGDHPAVQLLVQTVDLIATKSSTLDPLCQSYTYEAVLSLLGALQSTVVDQSSAGSHRFVRALADIDAGLAEPGLSAATLASAQGISRRRLDAIFAERGASVERVIWSRRLERAASDIACSTKSGRKLLDIALACGFASEAHFSRRFRAHFGSSPGEYRRIAAARRERT